MKGCSQLYGAISPADADASQKGPEGGLNDLGHARALLGALLQLPKPPAVWPRQFQKHASSSQGSTICGLGIRD